MKVDSTMFWVGVIFGAITSWALTNLGWILPTAVARGGRDVYTALLFMAIFICFAALSGYCGEKDE